MLNLEILNYISNWIKEIVLVFIFASIVEMIVPNNSIKRYINMFIGILIILAILNPIIKLIDVNLWKDISIDTSDWIEFQDLPSEIDRDEEVLSAYLYNIENNIIKSVKENTKYQVLSVFTNIHISKDIKDRLTHIDLELVEEKEEIKINTSRLIKKIEKVEIGNKREEIRTENVDIDNNTIKEVLSIKYEIPKENIRVSFKN